jgi:hypothetical protein
MEAPAGTRDMGTYSRGVYTPEQQARLSVDEDGKKVTNKVQALPPAHLTGSMEAPAGTRDMGTYSRGVYTPEQQARLSVDENGTKVEKLMQALPPAHLTGSMEAPAGTRDVGTFTRAVYSMEQQFRLSIDENGQKRSRTDLLLETAFINFDENKDGTVSCEEFTDFANTLGGLGQLSNEMVQIMIETVDKNGDGILQLDEFKVLMSTVLSENFGDIKDNENWYSFFCKNFLTKRQAREFGR